MLPCEDDGRLTFPSALNEAVDRMAEFGRYWVNYPNTATAGDEALDDPDDFGAQADARGLPHAPGWGQKLFLSYRGIKVGKPTIDFQRLRGALSLTSQCLPLSRNSTRAIVWC